MSCFAIAHARASTRPVATRPVVLHGNHTPLATSNATRPPPTRSHAAGTLPRPPAVHPRRLWLFVPCVAGGILTGYIGVAIEKVLFILFTMRLPSERVGGPPSCNPRTRAWLRVARVRAHNIYATLSCLVAASSLLTLRSLPCSPAAITVTSITLVGWLSGLATVLHAISPCDPAAPQVRRLTERGHVAAAQRALICHTMGT